MWSKGTFTRYAYTYGLTDSDHLKIRTERVVVTAAITAHKLVVLYVVAVFIKIVTKMNFYHRYVTSQWGLGLLLRTLLVNHCLRIMSLTLFLRLRQLMANFPPFSFVLYHRFIFSQLWAIEQKPMLYFCETARLLHGPGLLVASEVCDRV